MKIITGLGNPGKEYVGTRHNAGFDALVLFAEQNGIDFGKKIKRRSFIGEGAVAGERVVLLAPQTYMNLSGEALRENLDFYKLAPDGVIVVYDDKDTDLGEIRIRKQGTAGGHNGVKNIILRLNTDAFLRVKIGIGARPERWDLKDYVLSKMGKEELEDYGVGVVKAAEALGVILREGADKAMNKFNTKNKGAAVDER